MRADHQLRKAIYKHLGLETLRWWESLPFIDATDQTNAFLEKRRAQSGNYFIGSREYLPWPEAIYTFGPVQSTRGGLFCPCVFVGRNPVHLDLLTFRIYDVDKKGDLAVSELLYGPEEGCFDVQIFQAAKPRGHWVLDQKNPKTAEYFRVCLERVIATDWIIDRIINTDRHLLERTPEGTRSRMKARTLKKKPWLRDDLPTTVLINLADAKLYGHRPHQGGTHASPHPHTRYGHWMTLRAERYGKNKGKRIWRKQIWVGDKEWSHKGTNYRVIDQPTKGTP